MPVIIISAFQLPCLTEKQNKCVSFHDKRYQLPPTSKKKKKSSRFQTQENQDKNKNSNSALPLFVSMSVINLYPRRLNSLRLCCAGWITRKAKAPGVLRSSRSLQTVNTCRFVSAELPGWKRVRLPDLTTECVFVVCAFLLLLYFIPTSYNSLRYIAYTAIYWQSLWCFAKQWVFL